MKNQLTITILSFVFALSAFAQDFEAPKKGAKIYVDNTALELNENETLSFDLYLIKSKVARKSTFEAPRFLAPDGLNFTVTQDATDSRLYKVMLNADEIAAGDYSVTVTGKRSGIHAVTGTILSVKVKSSTLGQYLELYY